MISLESTINNLVSLTLPWRCQNKESNDKSQFKDDVAMATYLIIPKLSSHWSRKVDSNV